MQTSYQEWFEKAQIDEMSAHALIKNQDGHPNTVCFLSQQMVEKLLKGFLVFHKKEFARVHDLLQLETILQETEPTITELHGIFILLNRFYVETRYPGDFPQFSWTDAAQALEGATKVKDFILDKTK